MGFDRVFKSDIRLSDFEIYWIYQNIAQDDEEKVQYHHELIKILNARLRPETSPELNKDKGEKVVVSSDFDEDIPSIDNQ